MIPDTELAEKVMIESHKGQTRWDGRPYSVHPQRVVSILDEFGCYNQTIQCAAYLHGVLEDTDYPEFSIEKYFGPEVLRLVKELTMPKTITDTEGYVEHCSKLSKGAKLIKVADILANITDEGHKSEHFIRKRIEALKVLL